MKVVGTSNYGSETFVEFVVSEGLTEEAAEDLVAVLNEGASEFTPTWYIAVPDDYSLWRGMSELV